MRMFDAKDATPRVTFSPDGATLAVETTGGAVRLWNTIDGSAIAMLEPETNTVPIKPLFTADGSKLLTLSTDAVQTWRVRDGALQRTQKLTGVTRKVGESVTSAALSADGTLAALAVCVQKDCASVEVRLWRTADGASAGALKGAAAAIQLVAFSPDGSLLAGAACRKTESHPCAQVDLLVWRLRDSKYLYVVSGHTDSPIDLAFSADGAQLASAAADGSVIVWRASNGEMLLQLQHTAAVNSLFFSADGNTLLGGANPPAQWRLPAGAVMSFGDMPGAPVALSPDGHTLVLLNADGQIVLWRSGE